MAESVFPSTLVWMDFQTLTDTFGIPGVLEFDQNEAGLIRARVTTPSCTAELYLHGAHLTQWQPLGEKPVLFLSPNSAFVPGKAIRGGVPVIFPWFGPRSETAASSRTDGPSHGFARLEAWDVAFAAIAGDDLHLTLTLAPNETSRALGFDHFRLAFQLVLGKTLTLRLTVANEADEPLIFEEALHTYFDVADATQVRILGLQGTEFLDKVDHLKRKTQTDPALVFTGETDRPYLNTQATVTLEDPTLERRIVVAKSGSNSTVTWNPWAALSAKAADLGEGAWKSMTCIETANVADNTVTLAPKSAHTMEARISVETL